MQAIPAETLAVGGTYIAEQLNVDMPELVEHLHATSAQITSPNMLQYPLFVCTACVVMATFHRA